MIHKFDGYGSHIMILEKVKQLTNFKNILEFGGGNYSTPYFMKIPGSKVTTIESQSYDWYLKVKEINPNTLWMPDHNEVLEYTKTQVSPKDLVFLDTHQDLRYKLVPIVCEYTQTIILHDSETTLYKYHEIQLDSKKWHYADFVLYRPWTGLLCTSQEIIQEVLKEIPGVVCTDMANKLHIANI